MSDELTELPEGWQWINLSELGKLINGDRGKNYPSKDAFVEEGIPFINAGHLQDREIELSEMNYISEERFNLLGSGKVQPNDILYCLRGSLGKIAIVKDNISQGAIASSLVIIRPFGCTIPEYLLQFLISPLGKAEITKFDNGSAQPNLSAKSVGEYSVPLPPLNEQKRIVAKIEELRDRHQAAKQALEAVPELCGRFRQSTLAAAFRGDLTADWREENPDVEPASVLVERIKEEKNKNESGKSGKAAKRPNVPPLEYLDIPGSWETVLSHDLFSFVTSGSRGWAQYYSDEGAIFIRVGNLDRCTTCLDLTDIQKVRPPQGAEGTRTKVQPGDILVSITADIGMVGLVPSDIPEAYINQHVALARPLQCFSREYLAWYLASPQNGFKQFQQLQRGATKIGLGLDDIKSVWVPLPSLQEQKEIVKRIEQFFQAIQILEEDQKEVQNHLEHLTQAILTKAFCGELVEQDPNDEPASVLLNRIRAEREAVQGSKTKKSTKGKQRKTSNKVDKQLEISEIE